MNIDNSLDQIYQIMAKISYNAHDASKALRRMFNMLSEARTSNTTETSNKNSDFDFLEQNALNEVDNFLNAEGNRGANSA